MNDENDVHTEYFNYIESLKHAIPNDAFDYTLTLNDPKSNSLDEAPITFNFNSNEFPDRAVAELILNYDYHNIPYDLIARTDRYQNYLKNIDVNRSSYENTLKLDVDLYDHNIIIYRSRNNLNFNHYLKNKREIKTILNKKLPKEVNILQYLKH